MWNPSCRSRSLCFCHSAVPVCFSCFSSFRKAGIYIDNGNPITCPWGRDKRWWPVNALDVAAENGHWVILQVRGEGAVPLGRAPSASALEGLPEGQKGTAFTSLAGTPTALKEGSLSSHIKHGSAWSAGGLGRHHCPGDASADPSAVRKTSPLLSCAGSTASPWPCSLSKPPSWSPPRPCRPSPGLADPAAGRTSVYRPGPMWGTPGSNPSLSSFYKTIPTASPVTSHLSPKTLPHLPHHPCDSSVL